MRVEICYEDALQYNWFLIKDAIQLPEEAPLTWGYDFQKMPLGKAVNFQRETDGCITAELVFHQLNLESGDVRESIVQDSILKGLDENYIEPSMWANEVTDERCEDLRIIYKAILKAVCLVISNPTFPKIPEGVIKDG